MSPFRVAVVVGSLREESLRQPEVSLQHREGFFDTNGGFGRDDTRKFLQSWIDKYVASIKKHNA